MNGSITIRGARLVLPDRVVTGDLIVVGGVIEQVGPGLARTEGEEIDGAGLTVLPGLVDPVAAVPMDDGGDAIARATGSAALAGVTSMVLRDPARRTLTADDLAARLELAARHARVHVGVLVDVGDGGPTVFDDVLHTPGLYLGVGRDGPWPETALEAVLENAPGLVVVEGEDPEMRAARVPLYADATDPAEHSAIAPPELAAAAVERVAAVARRLGRSVHFPRITSVAEIEALGDDDLVTGQVAFPYVALHAERAYGRLGVRAVADPPVRDAASAAALLGALRDERLLGMASGHATVSVGAKDVPYPDTPGGLPTVAAWLPWLLDRVHRGELSLRQIARWTAEAPARRLGLRRTGRVEVGYDADLVLVDTDADVTIGPPWRDASGWSPLAGFSFRGKPVMTVLRGRPVARDGRLVDGVRGRELAFSRTQDGGRDARRR